LRVLCLTLGANAGESLAPRPVSRPSRPGFFQLGRNTSVKIRCRFVTVAGKPLLETISSLRASESGVACLAVNSTSRTRRICSVAFFWHLLARSRFRGVLGCCSRAKKCAAGVAAGDADARSHTEGSCGGSRTEGCCGGSRTERSRKGHSHPPTERGHRRGSRTGVRKRSRRGIADVDRLLYRRERRRHLEQQ
jgi:hypothetical protein